MQEFTKKAVHTIKNIPAGKVMTYGQVAAHAGSPRGARQIARLLHSMSSKHELPWHRIVNVQGKVALQDEEARSTQTALLSQEGVTIDDNGRIDLDKFRFDPAEVCIKCPGASQ